MIKIVVDTEEELNIVRRVCKTETCTHNNCQGKYTAICAECVDQYCKNKVKLYKNEIVEMPEDIVV